MTQQNNRRDFIKKLTLAGTAGIIGIEPLLAHTGTVQETIAGNFLVPVELRSYYQPLETIRFTGLPESTLEVYDAAGNAYVTTKVKGDFSFMVGGNLPFSLVVLKNKKQEVIDRCLLKLEAETHIWDSTGYYQSMFKRLYQTLVTYNEGAILRYNHKFYRTFVSWFQDHMYALQGFRYFEKDIKSGADLIEAGQREDGMVHDNFKHPLSAAAPWKNRFDYGNFVHVPEDPLSSAIFVRIPVENIAEFTYIELVYNIWYITGDNDWMRKKLDSMLKAVNYSFTDPYRWSEKFQLLKRGYTIDMWDFQNDVDTKLAGNDIMRIDLDTARFGIFYGDNVRMAASCGYLAEMLEAGERLNESREIKIKGENLKKRIDELSWNGNFYRHIIPENHNFTYDFGVDETRQVTLNNAYVLTRGVTHNQATAIIKTYQQIRSEMPKSSPGEWYLCYPPYEKGWPHPKWEYMNAGVSPIVAGQLSKGAFEHGFEAYAVDILNRLYQLSGQSNERYKACYKGAIEPKPERNFDTLSLRQWCNTDFSGNTVAGVNGWTGEGDNDMVAIPTGKQVFKDIPFDIVVPASNQQRACIGLSSVKGYAASVSIPLNKKTRSLYLLHTAGKFDACVGALLFNYTDGSKEALEVNQKTVGNWWYPSVKSNNCKVAWTGSNPHSQQIGVYVWGINNPHPDKTIKSVELVASITDALWMVLAISLCDQPVYFDQGILSYGIPDTWGAGDCFIALMEGLCGVQSLTPALAKARIAPRWSATEAREVQVVSKYEASGTYVAYQFKKNRNSLLLTLTGSFSEGQVEVLLPEGFTAKNLICNGENKSFEVKKVEQSSYLVTSLTKTGVYNLTING